MRHYLFYLFILIVSFSSCSNENKSVLSGTKRNAKTTAPTAKYRIPSILNQVNPFQGTANKRLAKSKRKKIKLFKRQNQQNSSNKRSEKSINRFSKRNRVHKSRIKTSGSRSQPKKGGNNKKSKNLFDTKKE